MIERINIAYGEFYDFPRMLRFQVGDRWYFLRSYFDDQRDDYADVYDVYLLPFRSDTDFESQPTYWVELEGAVHLGQVPVTEIGLDPTRRLSIERAVIESWLNAHP